MTHVLYLINIVNFVHGKNMWLHMQKCAKIVVLQLLQGILSQKNTFFAHKSNFYILHIALYITITYQYAITCKKNEDVHFLWLQ